MANDRAPCHWHMATAAVLALYMWPTSAPFDPTVLLVAKSWLWSCWRVLPLLSLGLCALSFRVEGEGRRRAIRVASCALSVPFVYVGLVAPPRVQLLGDEWLLGVCLVYCDSPFDDCRTVFEPTLAESGDAVLRDLRRTVYGEAILDPDVEVTAFGDFRRRGPSVASVVGGASSAPLREARAPERRRPVGPPAWRQLRRAGGRASRVGARRAVHRERGRRLEPASRG